MPVAFVLIPAAEALAAGASALRMAMLANRARTAYQAAQAARTAAQVAQAARAAQAAADAAKAQAEVKAKEEDKTASASDTTTVVGKKKLDCGEDGSYGDLQKRCGDNMFDRDHIPSKAALQKAAQNYIIRSGIQLSEAAEDILFGDNGTISRAGRAIVTPKNDHKKHSRTYGSKRNNKQQISDDAKDLQKAAEKDTKAMEDALDDEANHDKEMDPECLEKYKKAAEKIRQKNPCRIHERH